MARLTFLEVQAYANNAGYKLEKRSQGGYSLNNEHYIFLYSEPNEYGNKAKIGEYRLTALADVLLTIKEGYLLQGECSLIKEETETHLETYVNEVKDKEVKEVVKEEYYSSVHRTFLKVGSKYSYVDPKNDIFQDVVFEDANGTAVLNFRAIDKNGNKVTCEGSLFVVTEYNRDCLKPFINNNRQGKGSGKEEEGEKEKIRPLNFKEIKTMAENNVIKTFASLKSCKDFIFITEEGGEIKEINLIASINHGVHHTLKLTHDPVFNSQLVGTDLQEIEPLNVDKSVVTEVIGKGQLLNGESCAIALNLEEEKEVKNLDEEVKSGELLLQSDNCDLPEEEEIKRIRLTFKEIKTLATDNGYELEPLLGMFRLIKNNKILTFSSLKRIKDFITLPPEEEEDMLTKESNEAIKILVKYDFTMRELTQFEQFALTSLKKYVESGEPPKLIKTFAEALIRKLTPEEKHELRDKALAKVFEGDRLDEIKSFYDVNDKKQKLKQQLKLMDDETWERLCKDAGVKVDNFHKTSLKWLDFINLNHKVPGSSWEESWEEFKESEEFKELI